MGLRTARNIGCPLGVKYLCDCLLHCIMEQGRAITIFYKLLDKVRFVNPLPDDVD